MIFADQFFLYVFLPAVLILYILAGFADKAINTFGRKIRSGRFSANENPVTNAVLIVFSLIFYAWGEPIYILLMLFSVAVNYAAGLLITRKGKRSKAALAAGVTFNIALIFVFKYAGFLVSSVNSLGFSIPMPDIVTPVGISFYTFQSISYLADVYRGDVEPQKDPFLILLYISMFPQLIAGPIVRYGTIAEDIIFRNLTLSDVSEGSFKFFIGLGKKVILANQLSIISEQFLDGDVGGLSVGGAWLGLIAFTLQIYFDFSGYSDMAIGMGRCFGFRFDENFNYPYISRSITEFWRRWHISLGSFFRDYVYIPMGGNKRHQPLNIMTVWLLTGLWHGASWNFVIWGLYFGIIVMLEKYTLLKVKDKIPKVFLHIYSLFLIIFGWAIFYFDDMGRLVKFVKALFGAAGNSLWDIVVQDSLAGNLYLLAAAVICSLPLGQFIKNAYAKSLKTGGSMSSSAAAAIFTMGKAAVSVILLTVSTLLLISGTNNPFLYFRF